MRFSVWRPALKCYDVFETPITASDVNTPTVKHLPVTSPHGLGIAPEAAGWLLPPHATAVGQSKLPQGRVATTAHAGSWKWIAGAVGAVIAYRWWKRRRS